jgi:hypothetical protein
VQIRPLPAQPFCQVDTVSALILIYFSTAAGWFHAGVASTPSKRFVKLVRSIVNFALAICSPYEINDFLAQSTCPA